MCITERLEVGIGEEPPVQWSCRLSRGLRRFRYLYLIAASFRSRCMPRFPETLPLTLHPGVRRVPPLVLPAHDAFHCLFDVTGTRQSLAAASITED